MPYRPVVFVGSTREAIEGIASKVSQALSNFARPMPWYEGRVFELGHSTLSDLTEKIPKCDFAVLILGNEDQVHSRDVTTDAPRDNVIFELGLAIGALGSDRAVFLHHAETNCPSDLKGIYGITYDVASIDKAVEALVKHLRERVPRLPLLDIVLAEELRTEHDSTRTFGHIEFASAMAERVQCLAPGDTLRALCANKDWGHELQSYLDANVAAANGGANITRIFIRDGRDFSESLGPVLQRHSIPGLRALVLPKERIEHRALPDEFGFALFDDCVFVHFGMRERGGRLYRSPCVLRSFDRLFRTLSFLVERPSATELALRGTPQR